MLIAGRTNCNPCPVAMNPLNSTEGFIDTQCTKRLHWKDLQFDFSLNWDNKLLSSKVSLGIHPDNIFWLYKEKCLSLQSWPQITETMQQVLYFKWNMLCDLQVLPSILTESDRWLSIGHGSVMFTGLWFHPWRKLTSQSWYGMTPYTWKRCSWSVATPMYCLLFLQAILTVSISIL